MAAFLAEQDWIARDEYALRFGHASARLLARWPRLSRRLLACESPWRRFVLWIQLRTRALDDVLLEYARSGGDQLVILGAGFDCRAQRFAAELARARIYEIDHPATQARKRALLQRAGDVPAPVEYLAWDFEAHGADRLPAVLRERGLDPERPTLVLLEGVTMYLSEAAIESTVACVRALGAAGSIFAFNYIERGVLGRDLSARAAALLGERHVFGWDPRQLPQWLAARGFRLVSQRSDVELAREYLPHSVAKRVHASARVAIAVRAPNA